MQEQREEMYGNVEEMPDQREEMHGNVEEMHGNVEEMHQRRNAKACEEMDGNMQKKKRMGTWKKRKSNPKQCKSNVSMYKVCI